MLAAIPRGLARLASFGGRDAPRQFWPYALTVVALAAVAMFAVMVRPMAESMVRMQRFAGAHPELAQVRSGPGQYEITIHGNHPELMPDMAGLSMGIGLIAAAAALLLAAAVARRLHDRGMTGFVGLLPVPFLAVGVVAVPAVMRGFGSGHPNTGLFLLLFVNNLLYLGSLALLVVLLAGGSTPGPNRYGEPPDEAA